MCYLVLKWDTSDHEYGYDLWLKAVLADGGKRCQLQCDKGDQPLIEGMLVGTEKDRLDLDESNLVTHCPLLLTRSGIFSNLCILGGSKDTRLSKVLYAKMA